MTTRGDIMGNVLITGATSGIGLELAKVFAMNGYDLILVSSNRNNLEKTKEELMKKYAVKINIFEQDLSQIDSADALYHQVKQQQLDVEILINNAGIGYVGSTIDISIKQDQQMLLLNIISLVNLTKLYLNDFKKKGFGKILNVSSTGAFQPGPYTSTYFASKSFVLNYTRAIRREVKKDGISVCALCPGSTKTAFFTRASQKTPKHAMDAGKVALIAYRGLMKNKEMIIPGFTNKLIRLVPMGIRIKFVERIKGQNKYEK